MLALLKLPQLEFLRSLFPALPKAPDDSAKLENQLQLSQ
jgi:hypothetical protein